MGKVIKVDKLTTLRNQLPKTKTVVLATGVFDILHVEHVRFLTNAKKEGDILIVGIESDNRVRELKGKDRPVNQQSARAEVLEALEVVDLICILPENLSQPAGREKLMREIKPNTYAISENTPFQEEKKRIMKLAGGQLKIVHRYNPEISTTKLIHAKKKKNR